MIPIGSVLAAIAAAAVPIALMPRSPVDRRLALLTPERQEHRWRALVPADLRGAELTITTDQLVGLKLASAGAVVVVVGSLAVLVPLGPLPVLVGAYVGWIAPSVAVGERARAARREAERATVILTERVAALVAAGRPPETALAGLLERPTGSPLLDRTAQRATSAYVLGAPLFRTLATLAREAGVPALAALADDLERARDLGAASLTILRERRASMRQAERSRALEAASTVEGKLMLVLVLCYLPALMLLVVVPLFLSLMRGLGA